MGDSGPAPDEGGGMRMTAGAARRTGKILVLITEDWFALSHFKPLLATVSEIADRVVVATRSSGRLGEIASLGVDVVEFDLARASLDPWQQALVVRRLVALLARERPDVVHVIAMQPMVITSLALALISLRPKVMMHLTGLGFLGISASRAARLIRPMGLAALNNGLGRPESWLLAENPEDAQYLRDGGVRFGERLTLLGGAGLDPALFPAQPAPDNPVPTAAFVGRMIRPKGVEHLVAAHEILARRGIPMALALYGRADRDNPETIDDAVLTGWARRPGITWAGHVSDVAAVWRRSDIAVLPAITREGLPRAVLEAAASARPLIVTDVPGCRHFVRDGIEGLIVPPADPVALADALARLANDRDLRRRMGEAARQRFLSGFTVAHVAAGIRSAYAALLATGGD